MSTKKAPKKAPKKPAQSTGVIDTIEKTLVRAGEKKQPVSIDDIHKTLTKKFPQRNADALRSTIQHQIYYLPINRGLKLKKQRDGQRVRYMAKIKSAPVTAATEKAA